LKASLSREVRREEASSGVSGYASLRRTTTEEKGMGTLKE